MKVYSMTSPRTGNAVANQFEIYDGSKVYFQSYRSLIAEYDGETLTLGCDWDYSRTTMKYLTAWLNDHCARLFGDLVINSANIRRLISKGVIRYNPEMI